MLETHEHLTRQLDVLPVAVLDVPITVIGAGAIGSCAVLNLAKMGFGDITVYDFDEVDTVNLNCQWYRRSDIGRPKVEALAEIVEDFTGVKITALNEKYERQKHGGIMISSVDNMLTRLKAFKANQDGECQWFIDPRMSVEYAVMYVMKPSDEKDVESYIKTHFTDENGIQEACTAKATMYTSQLIGGLVAKAVKDLVTGNKYPRSSLWDIGGNNLTIYNKGV
jgi:hypothetical protein